MKNDAGSTEKRRYTFPSELRLKKSEEFKNVMKKGKKRVLPNFVVFLLLNGLSHPRLGITVSKSIGKAHIRNRVKRLIREYFRLHQHNYKHGFDIVVIARKGAEKLNYAMVKNELGPLAGEC
jgi:ribonuclease P protein component